MRDFIASDPKAPRFRKKSKKVSYKETYKTYIEQKGDIKYEEYKNIIKDFASLCREMIITTRYGVELPEGLGTLKVMSYKEKRKLYDIPTSKELGKLVTYSGLETDGLNAKIYYSTADVEYRFSNRELWKYDANRILKRSVSKHFKDNYKLYEECIAKRDMVNKNKKTYIPRLEDVFDDYNEFEI